jgi:hypothetical protein
MKLNFLKQKVNDKLISFMILNKKLILLIYSFLLICSWTYASDFHTPIAWKFYLPNYNVYADAGIYKITYSDLTKYNITPALLDLGKISIQNKNKDIPIFVSRSTGIWSPADYIEFYGEPPKDKSGNEDPYTKENVYWLVPQSKNPLRMSTQDYKNEISNSELFTPQSFLEKVHLQTVEQYRYFTDMAATFPKIWYWLYFRAPQSQDVTLDFPPASYFSTDTLVNIKIGLQAETHPPVTPTHHAVFKLNGIKIGDAYWNGFAYYSYETSFPLSLVTSIHSKLTIEAPGDIKSNPPMDNFLLDYIDYSYQRKFIADGGSQVVFPGEDSKGNKVQYQLSGFPGRDITVYEASQGKRIIPKVSDDPNKKESYIADFVDTPSRDSFYYAIEPWCYQKPSRCEPVYPSDLKDTTNQADYVILSYDDFIPELDRLVKWREKQGHLVKVVKVSDVYNEFNAGIFSPEAIKSFVDYAYHKWSGPQIKYLFLIGHANFDYKDNLKNMWQVSNVDFMPTCIYVSRASYIVSDNTFVALDSASPYPSLAVGRLNALSKEEVRNYVDKVLDYESPKVDRGQESRFLLAAGEASMFTDDLDNLAKEYLLPTFDISKAYVKPGPEFNVWETDSVARGKLQKAFRDGISFAYFAGHGSNGLWSDRKLLTIQDIPLLENKGHYPIVLSMTCFSGRFEYAVDTAYDACGICELLVRQKEGGAIAAFGSSGRAYVSTDSQLGRAILKGVLKDHIATLGDVIVQAKKSISDTDMVYGYTLFGDPALKIAVPENQLKLSVTNTSSTLVLQGYDVHVSEADGTVEMMDSDGKNLGIQNISCRNGHFQTEIDIPAETQNKLKYIRCKITDKKTKKEEIGWTTITWDKENKIVYSPIIDKMPELKQKI